MFLVLIGAICFMHFVIVSYSCGINFTHLHSSAEVAWFTLRPFSVMAGASLVYRGQGGAIEGPILLARGHQFKISNLHTPHTHRDPHTCAPIETLSPPSPCLYKAVFVISTSARSNPEKKKRDRMRASLQQTVFSLSFFLHAFPAINHSTLPSEAAISHESQWDNSTQVIGGQSVASIAGEEGLP